MDSQVTLVDSSLLRRQNENIVLELDVDNTNNTNLLNRGTRRYDYSVRSSKDVSITKVYRHLQDDAEGVLVAVIERGSLMPDKITFADGKSVRVGNWLKSSGLSDFPATMEVAGEEYVWRKNMVDQLSMCSHSASQKPLAWFQKSQRRLDVSSQDQSTEQVHDHAYLEFVRDVEAMKDFIVTATLILEHKIRMRAKTHGMASGSSLTWRGPASLVFSGASLRTG